MTTFKQCDSCETLALLSPLFMIFFSFSDELQQIKNSQSPLSILVLFLSLYCTRFLLLDHSIIFQQQLKESDCFVDQRRNQGFSKAPSASSIKFSVSRPIKHLFLFQACLTNSEIHTGPLICSAQDKIMNFAKQSCLCHNRNFCQ